MHTLCSKELEGSQMFWTSPDTLHKVSECALGGC